MESITRRDLARLVAAGAGVVVGAGLGLRLDGPREAFAAPASTNYPDCMLAVFTNSQRDGSDTIYMSADGYHFEKIVEAFTDIDRNDLDSWQATSSYQDGRTWPISTSSCPSIIWHNGYFWMLANQPNSGSDQRVKLMVTASSDLVHWCDPREVAIGTNGGWVQSPVAGQFDAVAADWAVDPSGTVWCVVSLGSYGAFHGAPQRDTMHPFIIKFNTLAGGPGFDPTNNPIRNDVIQASAQNAVKINLPTPSSNRIDGSLYFEGGRAYLTIKRNGITNEIWSIDSLDRAGDAGAWTLVCDNVCTGYEAPSLTKFNGVYYFFTDGLADFDNVINCGTYYQSSTSLSGGWTAPQKIDCYDHTGVRLSVGGRGDQTYNGPRHGTVLTVTNAEAKAAIWKQRSAAGWRSDQYLPRFSDVNPGDWFYGSVYYCAERGYMTGYSGSNRFGPNDKLNRAQVATVFMRILDPQADTGVLESNRTGMYDVADRQWYTQACNWACDHGVINGYGDGRLGPLDPVPRQQICVIIANVVAAFQGGNVADFDASKFEALPDAHEVDGWARDSVAWCLDHGIISGSVEQGTTYIRPFGHVTRGQMATILMNAIERGVITV